MMPLFVSLSMQPAPYSWGTSALSFYGEKATIHLEEDGESLSSIRLAARQIDSMGAEHICLQGDWSFHQQWAFAQSYCRAYKPGNIAWAGSEQLVKKLEHAFSALSFCRDLVHATPEELSPETLASESLEWLKAISPNTIAAELVTGEALKTAGWIGTYEVGRGSERPPVMMILDHNPSQNEDEPVDTILVGKGITFDSGGYSIKPSEGMLDMKCDMTGAATLTAALGLAIKQGLNKRVKLILCCAENLISGHAYKLGDILTYKNGVSVEVVNTDAEGRLVLADGLLAASESKPNRIIDAATLTGAAMNALGTDYHAVFTQDDSLSEELFECAAEQRELFWRLPLEPWHQNKCPSPFADTANSRAMKGGGAGGASNAAGFLSRFAPKKGWLHLDLAAAYHGRATGDMPAGATGKGILTLASVLNN